ncbi:hypothetical protein [Niabella beijingensis]|uniref:hypothetical protein n=1 Tax=Niabella beijingensis TaxID=2872700 RepID=UPI001CBEFAC7|nr:hypothetical protein [Niabella beijingensis]MBZ4188971.1 hypothetical protein [Niabella beijingensis]
MAEIKRRTILFSTGKQIRIYGNSVGIGKTLEVGEVYMPNIFSLNNETNQEEKSRIVQNAHRLTAEEFMELADLMMQYWLQLKDNIRKFGVENPKVFIRDSGK